MSTIQEKILKIFEELPYYSKEYVEDVYCSDIEVEDLTMQQFKEAVEISIEGLKQQLIQAENALRKI